MAQDILRSLLNFTVCLLIANNCVTSGTYSCPAMCRCKFNVTVSCDAGLQTIPKDISEVTKSLHLAGNVTLHNKFKLVRPADFLNISELRHFTFSFSEIEVIEDYTFRNLKELRQLRLNHNNIKQVGPRTFSGLSKLEILDLSDNPGLTILDGAFRELRSLQELYIGEINLQEIDIHVFDGLTNLNVLDMHGNSIRFLSETHINLFPNLKVFDISSNSLTTLDEKVWEFISRLQTLYIGGNSWECNCHMKILKSRPTLHNVSNNVICNGPSLLQYIPLSRVTESDLICQPPKITKCNTIPTHMNEGDSFQISCNITGDPFPFVEWKTPRKSLLYPYNTTFGSLSVYENGSLYLMSTSVLDSGMWTLKLSNSEGMIERNFSVDVQAIDKSTIPPPPPQTTTATTTTTIKTTTNRHVTHTPSPTTLPTTARQRKTINPKTTGEHSTSRKPSSLLTSSIPQTYSATKYMKQLTVQATATTPQPSQQSMSDFGQTDRRSIEEDWGSTGIIVASVAGGCSLIAITSILVLLKYISVKKKVGTTVTKDAGSTSHRRLAFV